MASKKEVVPTKVGDNSKPAANTKSFKIPEPLAKKVDSKNKKVKASKLPKPTAPFKRAEFFQTLAEQSCLTKKEVQAVVENITAIIKVHLVKGGPGQFTFPGIFKISSIVKAATKARKGRNPLTGEAVMIKAKPARKGIKIKVFKKFKFGLE